LSISKFGSVEAAIAEPMPLRALSECARNIGGRGIFRPTFSGRGESPHRR
jgi:hypothetical protein